MIGGFDLESQALPGCSSQERGRDTHRQGLSQPKGAKRSGNGAREGQVRAEFSFIEE